MTIFFGNTHMPFKPSLYLLFRFQIDGQILFPVDATQTLFKMKTIITASCLGIKR